MLSSSGPSTLLTVVRMGRRLKRELRESRENEGKLTQLLEKTKVRRALACACAHSLLRGMTHKLPLQKRGEELQVELDGLRSAGMAVVVPPRSTLPARATGRDIDRLSEAEPVSFTRCSFRPFAPALTANRPPTGRRQPLRASRCSLPR